MFRLDNHLPLYITDHHLRYDTIEAAAGGLYLGGPFTVFPDA